MSRSLRTAAIAIFFAAATATTAWLLLRQSRKLFTELTPGFHRQTNMLQDAGGHLLFLDPDLNMAFLAVVDSRECSHIMVSSKRASAIVECGDGVTWSLKGQKDVLVVGTGDGVLHTMGVRPSFVEVLASDLDQLWGFSSEDLAQRVLDSYRGTRGDSLEGLIGPSSRPAMQAGRRQ